LAFRCYEATFCGLGLGTYGRGIALRLKGPGLALRCLEAKFYGLGLGTYGRGIALRLKGPGSKAQVWP